MPKRFKPPPKVKTPQETETEYDGLTVAPTIQWYPGHIAKHERQLKEQLGMLDVMIEVIDARIPFTSRHHALSEWWSDSKPTLIILNKADLADPYWTRQWEAWFKAQGKSVVSANSQQGQAKKQIIDTVLNLAAPVLDKWVSKGLKRRPVRTGIVGMPNVGKSTLINNLVGKSKAKTGHRAGVTRQTQWVTIHEKIQLLDTPGVIPPKLPSRQAGELLACVYAVGDKAFDEESVVLRFLSLTSEQYPGRLLSHYQIPDGVELSVEAIAQSRGFVLSEHSSDTKRTSQAILKDFRLGRLGGITLERPPEIPVIDIKSTAPDDSEPSNVAAETSDE